MWLLNTHTAELVFFSAPEKVPGGYAILSHVWGNPAHIGHEPGNDKEDTFQEVQRAYQECQENARGFTNILASATPSDDTPVQAISALSAQVNDLSAQVQHLNSQLQALVTALQEHLPALTGLPATHRIPTLARQCSFTDLNIPRDSIATPPQTNARECLSPKIRNFLLKAEEHGFDWAWADTCCIDKTSSAELTEAINSMFQYYSLSEVCYAYLSDVPPMVARSNKKLGFEFEHSAWYKRGWTLQELIAPKVLVFMASDWTRIGTKYELAEEIAGMRDLQQINPPACVLRFEEDITNISVSQRMSWAAHRKTTRVEDQAYCLFGLFGINIPPLYGEGQNAFYRLQEEIMRTSTDTSLIAWDLPDYIPHYDWKSFNSRITRSDADSTNPRIQPVISTTEWKNDSHHSGNPMIPSLNITPMGVFAHLPVAKFHNDYVLVNIFCRKLKRNFVSGYYTSDTDEAAYLLLQRDHTCPSNFFKPACDLKQKDHSIVSFKDESESGVAELLGSMIWMDIYISARPPHSPMVLGNNHELISWLNLHPNAPFRIRLGMLSALKYHWGIELMGTSEVLRLPSRWDWTSPITLQFGRKEGVRCHFLFKLELGRCILSEISPHFVTVQFEQDSILPKAPSHDCNTDHVEAGVTRYLRLQQLDHPVLDKAYHLQVSLTKYHVNNHQAKTLDVHLEVIDDRPINLSQALMLLLAPGSEELTSERNNLLDYALNSMKDKKIALEGCEFSLTFANHLERAPYRYLYSLLDKGVPALLDCMVCSEGELPRTQGHDEDTEVLDKETDIKPRHYGGNSHGLEHDTNRDSGFGQKHIGAYSEDFGEGDSQEMSAKRSLRQVAAAALHALVVRFGPDLMNILLKPLKTKLWSNKRLERESGILVLDMMERVGGIDAIKPYVLYLIYNPESSLRFIRRWTLERYASWCAQLVSDEHKNRSLEPTLAALLRMVLDKSERVKEAGYSAFATLEEEAGPEIAPHLEPVLRNLVFVLDKYRHNNIVVTYDAVYTLTKAVGASLQDPTYVDILMPPLLERWLKLKDDDDELVPLLECLASVTIAIGPALLPYAGLIFDQCQSAIHRSLLQYPAYQENEMCRPDRSFLMVTLKLLSYLTQGLGVQLERYISHSPQSVLSLLTQCLKHSDAAVFAAVCEPVGYMAMNCFPLLKQHIPAMMQELIARLEPNAKGELCNNAAWAVGVIALQYGNDDSDFRQWVHPLILHLIRILRYYPWFQHLRDLHKSVAVSIGRIGLMHPALVAPLLPDFVQPWCSALYKYPENEEKDSAFRGICTLIQTNPAGITKSLLSFCKAIVHWKQPSPELDNMFQTLLTGFKQHDAAGWAAQVASFPPDIQKALATRYGS